MFNTMNLSLKVLHFLFLVVYNIDLSLSVGRLFTILQQLHAFGRLDNKLFCHLLLDSPSENFQKFSWFRGPKRKIITIKGTVRIGPEAIAMKLGRMIS